MDIDLYLEPGDMKTLLDGEILKTVLVNDEMKSTERLLMLRLRDNAKLEDGFYVDTFEDPKLSGYEAILGYDVLIDKWAYQNIFRQGHYGTRYGNDWKITVSDKKAPF